MKQTDFHMWSTGDRVKDDVTGYSEFYLFICLFVFATMQLWGWGEAI